MINDGDKIIREQIGSIEAGHENIVFDKEAVWSKLEARIGKEKRVYPLSLKWAAAATVLLMIATTIVLLNKKETPGVAATKKIVRPAEELVPVVSMPAAPASQPDKEPFPTKVIRKRTTEEVVKEKQPEVPVPVPETLPVVNAVADIVKPDVAAPPKMKVVHINELDEQERMGRIQYSSRYATGRSSIFFFRSASETSLLDDNTNINNTDYQPHRLFKVGLTQN